MPGGSHTPTIGVVAQHRPQRLGQAHGPGERLAVVEVLPLGAAVDDARTKRVPGRDAHELAVDGHALRRAVDGAFGGQILHGLAHVGGGRVRRQRGAVGNGDVVGQFLRQLPKDTAAEEAENAAPDLIQADREDRRPDMPDDLLEAAGERQHEAGAGEAPLGEDADQLAAGHSVGGAAQRLHDGARPGGGIDGNDAGPAKDASEQPHALRSRRR